MSLILSGLSAVKTAFDLNETIVKLLGSSDTNIDELLRRTREVNGLLLEAQTALHAAAEENRQLRESVSQRADVKQLEGDMEVCQDGGFYVKKSERSQGIFNVYCPVCFGLTQKAVPLVAMASGYYSCAIHRGATYQTKAYREAEERQRAEASQFRVSGGSNSWMR